VRVAGGSDRGGDLASLPRSADGNAIAGAACEVRSVTEGLPTGTSLGHERRYAVVNANLDLVGAIVGSSLPRLPTPGDRDADGCIETVTSCIPDIANPTRSARMWATVRLGPATNAVAGIVLVDYTPWRAARVWIRPEWGDEDADGRQELLLLAWPRGRLPSGRMGFLPPETLAVFEWNHPGGILRPKTVPNDGFFLVWTPPDGKPYPFSPDECVDDVARKLLPIPDAFGVPATAPAASQSATGPAGTQPATQPAAQAWPPSTGIPIRRWRRCTQMHADTNGSGKGRTSCRAQRSTLPRFRRDSSLRSE